MITVVYSSFKDTTFSDSRIWARMAAGLVSHNAFFTRGEHHLQAPVLLRLGLVVYVITILVDLKTGFRLAMEDTLLIFGSFTTALPRPYHGLGH